MEMPAIHQMQAQASGPHPKRQQRLQVSNSDGRPEARGNVVLVRKRRRDRSPLCVRQLRSICCRRLRADGTEQVMGVARPPDRPLEIPPTLARLRPSCGWVCHVSHGCASLEPPELPQRIGGKRFDRRDPGCGPDQTGRIRPPKAPNLVSHGGDLRGHPRELSARRAHPRDDGGRRRRDAAKRERQRGGGGVGMNMAHIRAREEGINK